jgi:hypothetical protein
MNWKRGLVRVWITASVSLLIVVGVFAAHEFSKAFPFGRTFQYSEQTREMPWNTDWSKPFYARSFAPSKGNFPESFPELEEQYVQDWDRDVKNGKLVSAEFPDHTLLYLNAEISKADQDLLGSLFWQQRWKRYLHKVYPWVSWAFWPPLIVLLLGFMLNWVRMGFSTRAG